MGFMKSRETWEFEQDDMFMNHVTARKNHNIFNFGFVYVGVLTFLSIHYLHRYHSTYNH